MFAKAKFSVCVGVGFVVSQDRLRLARVVVAVVVEEHDLPADFLLEPARSHEFCIQKTPREKCRRAAGRSR
ncbi:MAG: hypothetical protein QM736_05845 [Vicinamibacterales bacterium]